ncbi:hypothetical protein ACH5RR_014609 [Cinchona calisaya]|uniref:Uncharacterized protein n=1 Tax=Cinchona calisaya TaxID=153742 RepID=A0ABD3A5Z0_9GENT
MALIDSVRTIKRVRLTSVGPVRLPLPHMDFGAKQAFIPLLIKTAGAIHISYQFLKRDFFPPFHLCLTSFRLGSWTTGDRLEAKNIKIKAQGAPKGTSGKDRKSEKKVQFAVGQPLLWVTMPLGPSLLSHIIFGLGGLQSTPFTLHKI